MAKRISHKNVGDFFQLRFRHGSEKHQLVGFYSPTGEKEQNTAAFREIILESEDGLVLGTTWTAYRFHGRWCYGTSADILVVEE